MINTTTHTAIITARRPNTSPKRSPKFGLLSSCPVALPTMFTEGLDVKFTATGGVVVAGVGFRVGGAADKKRERI